MEGGLPRVVGTWELIKQSAIRIRDYAGRRAQCHLGTVTIAALPDLAAHLDPGLKFLASVYIGVGFVGEGKEGGTHVVRWINGWWEGRKTPYGRLCHVEAFLNFYHERLPAWPCYSSFRVALDSRISSRIHLASVTLAGHQLRGIIFQVVISCDE